MIEEGREPDSFTAEVQRSQALARPSAVDRVVVRVVVREVVGRVDGRGGVVVGLDAGDGELALIFLTFLFVVDDLGRAN